MHKDEKESIVLIKLFHDYMRCFFLVWVTNNINNEKQLNEDLSVRFDETMTQTFPLLEKVARTYYYLLQPLMIFYHL